jgi:hypothetical protein
MPAITLKARHLIILLPLTFPGPSSGEQVCDASRYPLSAPTDRFADNGDGTVTDKQSNLMWMRCSAGQQWSEGDCVGDAGLYSLESANQLADEINRSGIHFFNDWRLPTLPELAGIAERQCSDPRINLEVFPETPSSVYWTSSERPGKQDAGLAYGLSFGAEGVIRIPKSEPHLLRLVRTGP